MKELPNEPKLKPSRLDDFPSDKTEEKKKPPGSGKRNKKISLKIGATQKVRQSLNGKQNITKHHKILLLVLTQPQVSLDNNDSERDIREYLKR
ncbi:MAG: hypothetical protein ACPG49_07730 [Chitinophagales bacterium]